MQMLDVDLFIYKARMNLKPIFFVFEISFLGNFDFQLGWQMISSFVEKLVLEPNLFIMKIFWVNSTHEVLRDILI